MWPNRPPRLRCRLPQGISLGQVVLAVFVAAVLAVVLGSGDVREINRGLAPRLGPAVRGGITGQLGERVWPSPPADRPAPRAKPADHPHDASLEPEGDHDDREALVDLPWPSRWTEKKWRSPP